MPNPLTRRQGNSSKTDVDRPVAVTPVPERVQGHVFAYRGMETHGVDPNNDPRDPEDYGWMEGQRGTPIDFEPAPNPPDPIPVIIVQNAGRELKRFRTTRGSVDSRVQCVLGRDPLRRKVLIRNTSADPVYIGDSQQAASPMHGWPLAQNETVSIETQSDIYAVSSTSNVCVLAFVVEYVTVSGNYSG